MDEKWHMKQLLILQSPQERGKVQRECSQLTSMLYSSHTRGCKKQLIVSEMAVSYRSLIF